MKNKKKYHRDIAIASITKPGDEPNEKKVKKEPPYYS
jgi:hypothetical protein